jgi:hypothetical protein
MDYRTALLHVGHNIEVATYGTPPVNVSVECIDCYEVIADADIPGPTEAVCSGCEQCKFGSTVPCPSQSPEMQAFMLADLDRHFVLVPDRAEQETRLIAAGFAVSGGGYDFSRENGWDLFIEDPDNPGKERKFSSREEVNAYLLVCCWGCGGRHPSAEGVEGLHGGRCVFSDVDEAAFVADGYLNFPEM